MKKWWEKSTVYQIYPLSFNDSNNDGIGDLQGIIQKLDYLKELGVEVIWLSPVYQSPMDDNGYDISDYYAIHPMFGTMDDFKQLLDTAHKKGLKIIMDLVVNHTSDEHIWFKEAKKSKSNAFRDYYIWRDESTDQQSVFSGSAWEYSEATNQYYFHLFSKKQPDLNWDNPQLRDEIYRMINWWLDQGIDGFRLDVIDLIGKDMDKGIFANGPTLHTRMQELYEHCFKGRKIITVGETPCATIEIGKQFSNPMNHELDMIFNFQHVSLDQVQGKSKWELAPLDLLKLKQTFKLWQQGLHNEGWNSLFWCNHDQPRIISRYGDDTTYRIESAKMLATVIHFMQGTPFIYQGEEIGMTNVKWKDLSDYKDIETLNMFQEFRDKGWTDEDIMTSIQAKGRDNARTPMQWNASIHAGFSTNTPWIPVNPNYKSINVEASIKDPFSIYRFYQKLIGFRKTLDVIVHGDFKLLLPDHPQVFAYERHYQNEKLIVICNFKGDVCHVQCPKQANMEYLIGNYNKRDYQEAFMLRPYECLVFYSPNSPSFEIKEEQFILNGKKQFILGAECHYFRIPKTLWKDRLQKIKASGCNLVSTYIPWSFHEAIEGNIDLRGNTLPEKDLQGFLELTKEMGFLVLVRPGPYVMSEIREHGLPLWLFDHYPEVLAKRIDGSNHSIVSYLNETFLSLVDRWYRAVFEILAPAQITQGGNIIMCQLDNEVGMFPWVMNHPDYSDFVIEKFETYLQTNQKQAFNIKELTQENSIEAMNEFMLFHREYFRDYIEALKSIAQSHGLNVPVVVNVHGFHSIDYAKRGLQYPIGLSQLLNTVTLDDVVLAGDYYIGNIVPDNYFDILLSNAFTKAIQPKNQPLFSAEFQSGFQVGVPRLQPTTTDLLSRICIGNGMNAINYYMFVGGENYEGIGLMGKRHDWQAPIGTDGALRPHYYVVEHLSHVIHAYGEALLEAHYDTPLFLGFDPDLYRTEYDQPFTKPFKRELQRMREMTLFNGLGKALSFLNISYTGYNLLEQDPISIEKIPYLWVFSSGYMNAFVQQKCVDYVQAGGKLFLSPYLPTQDYNQNPCTLLMDQLDLAVKKRMDWQMISVLDLENISSMYTEAYPVSEGFAYREQTKEVIGYKKKIGLGELILFGSGIISEHDYKIEAYGLVAKEAGLHPTILADEWFQLSMRTSPKGNFLFIHNLDEYSKKSTFTYQNKRLFDGIQLSIPMRKGLILPLDWQVNAEVMVRYSTAELIDRNETEKDLQLIFYTQSDEVIVLETLLPVHINHGKMSRLNQRVTIQAHASTNLKVTISKEKGL